MADPSRNSVSSVNGRLQTHEYALHHITLGLHHKLVIVADVKMQGPLW